MELDLNVDIGEGFPFDQQLLQWVSSASIACGGHAGDRALMAATVEACLSRGVRIGAHPGYPDPDNFGRKPLTMAPRLLLDNLCEQLALLDTICRSRGATLAYVKPHGALYNQAVSDRALATLICQAIKDVVPHAALMGLAGSPMLSLATGVELAVIREGFLDRRYLHSGALVPRSEPNALIEAPEAIRAQLTGLAVAQTVEGQDGNQHKVQVDSLCLHGDSPNALERAEFVHNHLIKMGFSLPQH
ncbi:5-oxoprolinase subunit PxpA [Ferrimonas futtsuensis]|uniref:5-oxoprolinase subunit PxpA n=1 Tax=Ferrimonas futtsuensis TaxID=364764 RepID=UPI0004054F85|nr:5-oxoprolinase subunit PxpA [Ferrimonas futtsuensis]